MGLDTGQQASEVGPKPLTSENGHWPQRKVLAAVALAWVYGFITSWGLFR